MMRLRTQATESAGSCRGSQGEDVLSDLRCGRRDLDGHRRGVLLRLGWGAFEPGHAGLGRVLSGARGRRGVGIPPPGSGQPVVVRRGAVGDLDFPRRGRRRRTADGRAQGSPGRRRRGGAWRRRALGRGLVRLRRSRCARAGHCALRLRLRRGSRAVSFPLASCLGGRGVHARGLGLPVQADRLALFFDPGAERSGVLRPVGGAPAAGAGAAVLHRRPFAAPP